MESLGLLGKFLWVVSKNALNCGLPLVVSFGFLASREGLKIVAVLALHRA